MTGDVNDVIPGSDGLRILEFGYCPFYFLSASWMLAGAAELVSVVVLVAYSACSDFYTNVFIYTTK